MGSGGGSSLACMSATQSSTNTRIPEKASSWVDANQLNEGNSAHSPMYSSSSADQVTLYV